jgi:uncharacterized protein (TIGR03086 family)
MNGKSGSNWEVLDSAHDVFRSAVLRVATTDWRKRTPCEQWNVAQVFQHATGDQLGYASAITGGPGPSENPFTPSGQIDGDPLALLEKALEASAAAWATVSEDAADVPTPLPQGALPPSLGAGACALDAAVHGWDIAVATGQESPLTLGLAQTLMTVATKIVEPLRPYAVYAPALAPAADDDGIAALLRYLGRQPSWTA